MATEIGIGTVSLGWMGQLYTRASWRLLDHYPECELEPGLVIAADAVEDRARGAADRLGYEDWTTGWREVEGHPEVEAASIVAPNYLHKEVTVAVGQAATEGAEA
jgi:predicted dehydrogenase